jgi:tRNA 5-methylaminomethyl-2-thiouridine biosynthesis bifunctional protein
MAHPQIAMKKTKLQQFTQLGNRLAFQEWAYAQKYAGVFQPMTDMEWRSEAYILEQLDKIGITPREAISFDYHEAEGLTGIHRPGIWFKEGAVYDLPAICKRALSQLPTEHCLWDQKVGAILQSKGQWQVLNARREVITQAPILILANGLGVQSLLGSIGISLPMRAVRGQLSRFLIQKDSYIAPKLPRTALRGNGYCLPGTLLNTEQFTWEIGSSYDEDSRDTGYWQSSDEGNRLKGLDLIGVDLAHQAELSSYESFVGVRSASKDRLPLIGPILNEDGLFIATGYGSRGVIWSALGSRLIFAYVAAFLADEVRLRTGFLAGASPELESELASSVSPARFLAGALATRTSNSKPILPVS